MVLDNSRLMSKINPHHKPSPAERKPWGKSGSVSRWEEGRGGVRSRGVELASQWRLNPLVLPPWRHVQDPPPAAHYCYRGGSRAPRKLPLLGGHDGQQDGVRRQGRSGNEIRSPFRTKGGRDGVDCTQGAGEERRWQWPRPWVGPAAPPGGVCENWTLSRWVG